METVSHREMRNRSGEILRRVEAGETVRVSNNGRLAALIVPANVDTIELLVERGHARPARSTPDRLRSVTRSVSEVSSDALRDDLRGRW